MILRVRAFCREESLGIVLPAALIALFAAWQVIEAAISALLVPLVANLVEGKPEYAYDYFLGPMPYQHLTFHVGDVPFDWTLLFVESVTALVMGAILYLLFVRPIPEDVESETGMRDCPECFSRVFVEARRCAFCTSPLPPVEAETS